MNWGCLAKQKGRSRTHVLATLTLSTVLLGLFCFYSVVTRYIAHFNVSDVQFSPEVPWKQPVAGDAGSCEVRSMLASFRDLKDVSAFDTCPRIFYNRVPKCASRTILATMKALSTQLNFTFVSTLSPGSYRLQNQREIVNFTKEFNSTEEPFIYSRHLYFLDFTDVGQTAPVYINVIRDPLSRAVSHFYYKKFGSFSRPLINTNATINNTDDLLPCLDEMECATFFNVILPFFCGHRKNCKKSTSAEDRWKMLSRAKHVIRERYLVVGLTEDLPAFMEVLEGLMPSFFNNATSIFNQIGAEMKAKYRTVKKAELDEKLERQLKQRLAADYDLYAFVKQRFYNQLQRVRTRKTQRSLRKVFRDIINPD